MKHPALHRQSGMTLVVALVMLVLITLLAMTTFNLGKSSIQVVNNMQNRDEGIAASRSVLDEAMSSTRFFDTPTDALNQPCLNSNHRCFDLNGDKVIDIGTALSTPKCVKVRTIKSTELARLVYGDASEATMSKLRVRLAQYKQQGVIESPSRGMWRLR